MKTFILSPLFILFCVVCLAQQNKNNEKILYIVDSVAIINEPTEESGTLSNEDIDNLVVITDKAKIAKLGYSSIDKVIQITTKAFLNRTDEEKKIPSIQSMIRKNGIWFLKNDNKPYSGKFVDYFMNGRLKGDGIFKDGVVDGLRNVYYPNGNKSYFRNYINGIPHGYSEEYFPDGKIKQKGSFKNGRDDGLWQDFYSTGALKRQSTFTNDKANLSKDEERFYDLQNKAIALMKTGEYTNAIGKLDQAEKLNSKYADLYFYRGTAELESFNFDKAIIDFDKAIELEPLYTEALANRAFARIRKYEFKNSRSLSNTSKVAILAVRDDIEIPAEEKQKICSDLNKSVELGDNKDMVLDAIARYCK